MDAGNLIFLLLIVVGMFGMFAMHRGRHGHGGMGGCGGGHSHGYDDEPAPDARRGDEKKPLLGPPGTQSSPTARAPAGATGIDMAAEFRLGIRARPALARRAPEPRPRGRR